MPRLGNKGQSRIKKKMHLNTAVQRQPSARLAPQRSHELIVDLDRNSGTSGIPRMQRSDSRHSMKGPKKKRNKQSRSVTVIALNLSHEVCGVIIKCGTVRSMCRLNA